MTYQRVIPRDLFNEASLLKCLGRIYINLETADLRGVELEHDGEPFDIIQDESGCLMCANVRLTRDGRYYKLSRPLNSREPWPLYLSNWDMDEEIAVFDDSGTGEFSREFLEFFQ